MKSRLSLGLVLLALAACQDQPIAPAARFRGPMDSVLAGTQSPPQYLYLAGGVRNALYAMDARTGEYATGSFGGFVRAPNKFFPLEIPVGRSPAALAASSDGAYVLVVCAADNTVFLVSADDQTVVRFDNFVPVTAQVGRGAAAIVRVPKQATDTYAGERFIVANAADGSLQAIELVMEDGLPRLRIGETIAGVGAVVRAVVSSDGDVLYGADSSSSFVHRVNLRTKVIEQIDVGGPSLDVLLVASERYLYVARPDTLSVDVFNARSGARFDANPRFTPALPFGERFEGVYIGEVPSRLAFVQGGGQPDLTTTIFCLGTNGAQSTAIDAYVMVATDAGKIFYIDARQVDPTLDPRPPVSELVDLAYCLPSTVTPSAASTNLFVDLDETTKAVRPFKSCKKANSRRREECVPVRTEDGALVQDPAGGALDTGVTVFPGVTSEARWKLTWEGVIPGLDRKNGGGTFRLGSDGAPELFDVDLDLRVFGINAGDILRIQAEPLAANPDCAVYAEQSKERDLLVDEVVVADDGRTGLRFHPRTPIPNAPPINQCFSTIDGGVAYLVRGAESFLLLQTPTGLGTFVIGRLPKGGSFGGVGDPIRFTLRGDAGDPLEVVRDQVFEFTAAAPHSPLVFGRVRLNDGIQQSSLPAGRIPSSIIVGPFAKENVPLALVTYAGNDTVIAFEPLDSDRSLNSDAIVLR
ncbi:MAG: hypothetical protein IT381_16105 [Deltaproteobacteria bacterium]|nr:hypothetical protein [Deltaproteobacteria bacterium]